MKTDSECPWTSPDECAMAREREVAGVSDSIPACPVHGEFPVPVGELLE